MEAFNHVIEGNLEPLAESVLIHNLESGEKVVNDVIILDDDSKERGIRPRWAQVYSIGSKVDELKEGDWILIEHGRWTRGIKILKEDSETIVRMVDRKDILLVTDEIPL